ncbi:MAG TPA: hypothetical protein VHB70_04245 [Parafilimonas sp.]|nr:hypothetical protein [Parafilimonas sp.]
MKAIGIVLIVIGIVMMVFRSFNFTSEKKVADIGPLKINKEENHTVNWPLYAGIVVTVAGVVVLVAGSKNKA